MAVWTQVSQLIPTWLVPAQERNTLAAQWLIHHTPTHSGKLLLQGKLRGTFPLSSLKCCTSTLFHRPEHDCSSKRKAVKSNAFQEGTAKSNAFQEGTAFSTKLRQFLHMCSIYHFHYSSQLNTVPKPALVSKKAATSYSPSQQKALHCKVCTCL